MPKFKRSMVGVRPKPTAQAYMTMDNDRWLNEDDDEMDDGAPTYQSGNTTTMEFSDVLQRMNGIHSSTSYDNGNASRSSSNIEDEGQVNESSVDSNWNSSEGVMPRKASKLNWDPNISLLELACKLKCAEKNVFGHSNRINNNTDSVVTSQHEPVVVQQSNLTNHGVPVTTRSSDSVNQEPFDLSTGQRSEDNVNFNNGHGHVKSTIGLGNHQSNVALSGPQLGFFSTNNYPRLVGQSIPMSVYMNNQFPRFSQIISTPVSMFFRPNSFGTMIPQSVSALTRTDFNQIIPQPVAALTQTEYSQIIPQPVSALTKTNYNQIIPQPVSALTQTDYGKIIPRPVTILSSGNANVSSQRMFTGGEARYGNGLDGKESNPVVNDANTEAKHQEHQPRQRSELRYRCSECSYATKSLSHLWRHRANIHAKQKPFRCYICSLEFSRSEKVREHFVSFHPDAAYEPYRTRRFSSASKRGSRDPSLPAKARMQLRIRELFASIEGNDVEMSYDPERPFGCLRCSYATRDLWHLRRHVLDIHAAKKHFNCRVCRYYTNRPKRLHAHMRNHGEMFCERCEYSSTRLDQFLLHDKLCLVEGEGFRCRTCLAEFADQEQLGSHVSIEHGSELLTCNQCSYFAFTEEDFAAHTEAHEMHSRTCHVCGITFSTTVDYDNHNFDLHLYKDAGSFMCNICSDSVDPPDDLKAVREHVRSHSPVKVPCMFNGCNFRALLEVTLDTHMENYHADSSEGLAFRRSTVKPEPIVLPHSPATKPKAPVSTPMVGIFACTICNRTPFKYYRSYEKHMAQHSQEQHR